jgi:hypothetical protein
MRSNPGAWLTLPRLRADEDRAGQKCSQTRVFGAESDQTRRAFSGCQTSVERRPLGALPLVGHCSEARHRWFPNSTDEKWRSPAIVTDPRGSPSRPGTYSLRVTHAIWHSPAGPPPHPNEPRGEKPCPRRAAIHTLHALTPNTEPHPAILAVRSCDLLLSMLPPLGATPSPDDLIGETLRYRSNLSR